MFMVTNGDVGFFGRLATTSAAKLVGDFDGNGRDDMVLVGNPGWASIPVAFATGDGRFLVTTHIYTDFAAQAAQPGVIKLAADFNDDRRTDLMLLGGGMPSIWIAYSISSGADGTFSVQKLSELPGSDVSAAQFNSWAASAGVAALVGAFDQSDARRDVALTGGANWQTIPVAHIRSGGVLIKNVPVSDSNWGAWASTANVARLVGDFDGDDFNDLALTGGVGWASIPVAFPVTDFSGEFVARFDVVNQSVGESWGAWASTSGVAHRTGRFDRNNTTDIALIRGLDGTGIPLARSNGDGTFTIIAQNLSGADALHWTAWVGMPGVSVLTGDFNRDDVTDVVLTGGSGWGSMPMALSNGQGTFIVHNVPVESPFGEWVSTEGVSKFVGNFHNP
jgi:hypothetical protein